VGGDREGETPVALGQATQLGLAKVCDGLDPAPPSQELIFRQGHPPGLQALSDFTTAGGLGVTLGGHPFAYPLHLSGSPSAAGGTSRR
jgi:hypothetical protein